MMILTDTGPLIALVDQNDFHHVACKRAADAMPELVMATTWPCLTEAMYLLGAMGDFHFQSRLWSLCQAGQLRVLDLTSTEIDHMCRQMEQYKDLPMDFADASLMAVAESRGYRRVFTLDSDFRIYRMVDRSVLEVVP